MGRRARFNRRVARACGFASRALDVLENGLVFHGNANPVRVVTSLLSETDVIPLPEDHNPEVRERAVAVIGTLQ